MGQIFLRYRQSLQTSLGYYFKISNALFLPHPFPFVILDHSATITSTVLEDICDKPIRIQSYCAIARLHGV
jgi:hypothetical protein